jgi:hypothetical protein
MYGWNWDGKNRGVNEVARRVDGVWSFTCRTFVMIMDKPKDAKYLNGCTVYQTAKQWRMKDESTFKLPEKCVYQKSVDNVIYNVVPIPGFLEYEMDGKKRSLVGCIGCTELGDAIWFGVDANDPMLVDGNFSVLSYKDFGHVAQTSSNPEYCPESLTDVDMSEKKLWRILSDLIDDKFRAEHFGAQEELITELDAQLAKCNEMITDFEERAKAVNATPSQDKGRVRYRGSRGGFEVDRTPNAEDRAMASKLELLKASEEKKKAELDGINYTLVDGKKVLNLYHLISTKLEKEKDEEPKMKYVRVSMKIADKDDADKKKGFENLISTSQ